LTIARVLVCTNESEESAAAARWAWAVAQRCGANLEFMEVVAGSAEQSPERTAELKATTSARIALWLDDVGGQRESTVVVEWGDVATEITAQASRSNADLVVVGSQPVEGFTGLALSSVVHDLAHHLSCPIVAVPAAGVAADFSWIVVGVDGSSASRVGLRWAEALAEPLHAKVCAVYEVDDVYETFTPYGSLGKDEPGAKTEVRGERRRVDIDFVERAAAHPADALQEVALERGAALIVVAARERGSLGGLLLGSTPDRLIHRPACPVAVLPHRFVEAAEAVEAQAAKVAS
jgi:nucleotide-binding universal stress UspA family protein